MRSRITAAALAALAALGACTRTAGPAGRVADGSAPPRSAFEVLPAAEAAAAKDPHQHRGKALCQRCHLPDLKLTGEANALCRACHTFGHGNHPVDVIQRTAAGGLPLLAGGKLACHSCHDPHRARAPLRRPFNDLCRSCHSRH